MPSDKQKLGEFGEKLVTQQVVCLRCNKKNTLKQLIQNFKCADIICDYCGFIAQVKTKKVQDITRVPKTILGAGWGPFKERLDDDIFFPLFVVLVDKNSPQKWSIYYLSTEFQTLEMFIPRKPLSDKAKRKGWQGFVYNLDIVKESLMKLV